MKILQFSFSLHLSLKTIDKTQFSLNYIEVVSHLMHPQSILGPGETIIFVDVNIFSWSALLAYAFSIHF